MPRAKETSGAGQITCPACRSKITPDGKTLESRSEFLSDLIEGDEEFKKAEEAIEKLEAQLVARDKTIKELETKLREGAQPAPATEGKDAKKSSRVGRLW